MNWFWNNRGNDSGSLSCREFDNRLMEWVSSRVPQELAVRMEAHEESCSACAELARDERALRGAWKTLPSPERTPELWNRLEARLSAPPVRQRPAFGRAYAFGGAMTAAAALCAVWFLQPRMGSIGPVPVEQIVSAEQETKVVDMVADIQKLHEKETETVFDQSPHSGDEARILLVGMR